MLHEERSRTDETFLLLLLFLSFSCSSICMICLSLSFLSAKSLTLLFCHSLYYSLFLHPYNPESTPPAPFFPLFLTACLSPYTLLSAPLFRPSFFSVFLRPFGLSLYSSYSSLSISLLVFLFFFFLFFPLSSLSVSPHL